MKEKLRRWALLMIMEDQLLLIWRSIESIFPPFKTTALRVYRGSESQEWTTWFSSKPIHVHHSFLWLRIDPSSYARHDGELKRRMDLVLERVGNNSAVQRHKNRMDSMQVSTERLSQKKAFREPGRSSLDKHIIKAFGPVALLSKSGFQLHSTNKIPYMDTHKNILQSTWGDKI